MTSSTTHSDLLKAVAKETNITVGTVKKIADALVNNIITSAKSGPVAVIGLGKFEVIDVPEKTGRNPSTGEQITIKAHRKLKFKASSGVKID